MSQNTARTRVEPLDLARDPLAEEGRGTAGHKSTGYGRGKGLHTRNKSKHHKCVTVHKKMEGRAGGVVDARSREETGVRRNNVPNGTLGRIHGHRHQHQLHHDATRTHCDIQLWRTHLWNFKSTKKGSAATRVVSQARDAKVRLGNWSIWG